MRVLLAAAIVVLACSQSTPPVRTIEVPVRTCTLDPVPAAPPRVACPDMAGIATCLDAHGIEVSCPSWQHIEGCFDAKGMWGLYDVVLYGREAFKLCSKRAPAPATEAKGGPTP